jgi:hypothetical protein
MGVFWVFSFFIFLNIAAFFMPKKLTIIENYTTSLFALLLGINVDMILNLKYKLYGYFGPGFQWLGLIGEFLYFIPVSVLFLNLYPYTSRYKVKVMYILMWSAISTLIEWLVEKTEFFNHHGWKLSYSAFAYPIVFGILIFHLWIVKKLLIKYKLGMSS